MRYALFAGAGLAAFALASCVNPNSIGVQKFGTVAALTVLASNNQPVANALVIVNSTQNCTTHADGTCQITMVPIGPQQVSADAPGLIGAPIPINVQENMTVNVTIPLSPST